jgi:ArsR family transcriptional regulator, arsenate/arsenite/antimonite-responsive transcriptional repressor
MDKQKTLDALAALSQEVRFDVFRLLVQAGPDGLPAGEIARRMHARQNTMSTNLAILARAGLISSTRDGRSIRYAADFSGMRAVIDSLLRDCCGGVPEITETLKAGVPA